MRKPDSTLENLTGSTYGQLTVASYFGMDKNKRRVWVCSCTCGSTVNVITHHLKKGLKKSCGCLLPIHPSGESATRDDAIKYAATLLRYEPESGHLYWLVNISKFVQVGRRAGSKGSGGYRYIMMHDYKICEHRVCWWIANKSLPEQIDHINGVRTDNRLCNLRAATNAENSRNRLIQSNNTSGYKGVSYCKNTKKFTAKIKANGVTKSLGYHATAERAHEAYVKAAKELHGVFANSGTEPLYAKEQQ